MYNRYIPQSDGTYQRNRIPDSPARQPVKPQIPQDPPCTSAAAESPVFCPAAIPPCAPEPRKIPHRCSRPAPRKQECNKSISGFWKQLLPQNFDTADLFVILLLLLMSGDCAEDQNTALLTLALYLFL